MYLHADSVCSTPQVHYRGSVYVPKSDPSADLCKGPRDQNLQVYILSLMPACICIMYRTEK